MCRNKLKTTPQASVEQVVDYLAIFQSTATSFDDLMMAAVIADEFQLLFFDALIVSVA